MLCRLLSSGIRGKSGRPPSWTHTRTHTHTHTRTLARTHLDADIPAHANIVGPRESSRSPASPADGVAAAHDTPAASWCQASRTHGLAATQPPLYRALSQVRHLPLGFYLHEMPARLCSYLSEFLRTWYVCLYTRARARAHTHTHTCRHVLHKYRAR